MPEVVKGSDLLIYLLPELCNFALVVHQFLAPQLYATSVYLSVVQYMWIIYIHVQHTQNLAVVEHPRGYGFLLQNGKMDVYLQVYVTYGRHKVVWVNAIMGHW